MTQPVPTIILCGGLGTRLKEETEYRPKPMVQVGEKPLLWHIMKNYIFYKHNRFILALGYKGYVIKDFFLNQNKYVSNFTLDTKTGDIHVYDSFVEDDMKVTFVDTGENTLTGERILRLKNYIDKGVFMVTYGDGLADVNIDELIEFHKKQNTIGTITGVNLNSKFGYINVGGNNVITSFEQKPKLHDFVNGGYMVFNYDFFDYLKPGDMIEHALLRLVDNKQLSLYKHGGFWFAVDTIRDLEEANRLWDKEGGPWTVNWRKKAMMRSAVSLPKKILGETFLKVHAK